MRVVAVAAPGGAGRVDVPSGRHSSRAHVAHVTVRSRPAPGWAAVSKTLSLVDRPARPLARRPRPERARARAAPAGAALRGPGRRRTSATTTSRRSTRSRRSMVSPGPDRSTLGVWSRLAGARVPAARYGGDHVEIDKTRQVLFVVRGGKVSADRRHLDGRDGEHAARRVARLPEGDRLRLGPLLPELLPARLCDSRLPGRAAVSGVARVRRASRCGSRRPCTPRSPTARLFTSTRDRVTSTASGRRFATSIARSPPASTVGCSSSPS